MRMRNTYEIAKLGKLRSLRSRLSDRARAGLRRRVLHQRGLGRQLLLGQRRRRQQRRRPRVLARVGHHRHIGPTRVLGAGAGDDGAVRADEALPVAEDRGSEVGLRAEGPQGQGRREAARRAREGARLRRQARQEVISSTSQRTV